MPAPVEPDVVLASMLRHREALPDAHGWWEVYGPIVDFWLDRKLDCRAPSPFSGPRVEAGPPRCAGA